MGASVSADPPTEEEKARLLEGLDSACKQAAKRISEADVCLLCTGAGFSADSGLAVYADVAKLKTYAERGLDYSDICQPHWRASEPELFWGFWGQCFNDYRSTAPHAGYETITAWAEQRFRTSDVARHIRQNLEKGPALSEPKDPYIVSGHPGGFFAFTSNVDAHHFDWFQACEIHECHGNTELYQCEGGCDKIWRAPLQFGFCVSTETMLAPAGASENVSKDPDDAGLSSASSAADPAATPRVGHVKGGGRPHLLRHMPGPAGASEEAAAGCWQNHPACPSCSAPARPAILMFGDTRWNAVDSQRKRFDNWKAVVQRLASNFAQHGPRKLRVVVLEFGAGNNVPTVRRTSESALQTFHDAGAEACLVRVNPDLPLGDMEQFRIDGPQHHLVIPIMARGISALEKIRASLPERQLEDDSCSYSTDGFKEFLQKPINDFVPTAACQEKSGLSRQALKALLGIGSNRDADSSSSPEPEDHQKMSSMKDDDRRQEGGEEVSAMKSSQDPDESTTLQSPAENVGNTNGKVQKQDSSKKQSSRSRSRSRFGAPAEDGEAREADKPTQLGALARVSGRLRAWDDTPQEPALPAKQENSTEATHEELDRASKTDPSAADERSEKGPLTRVGGRLRAWDDTLDEQAASTKPNDSAVNTPRKLNQADETDQPADDNAKKGALARVSGRLRAWDGIPQKRASPEKSNNSERKAAEKTREPRNSTDSANAANELEQFLAKKASNKGFQPTALPPKKEFRRDGPRDRHRKERRRRGARSRSRRRKTRGRSKKRRRHEVSSYSSYSSDEHRRRKRRHGARRRAKDRQRKRSASSSYSSSAST